MRISIAILRRIRLYVKYISGARLVTETWDGILTESGDQIITE
jgi:hypothetical protein